MPQRVAVLLAVCGLLLSISKGAAAPEPVFDSKVVTTRTKGHAVDVEVPLKGAGELYLVVTDGGNGISCDWADWAEPRLIGAGGKKVKKLTELKWKSAIAGWGRVRVNENAGGGPLRIDGKPVEYGIGTHAASMIVFDIPEGYETFKARAGLDNGGTNQNNGQSTSVRFLVYLEKPPRSVVRSGGSPDSGSRDPVDALAGLDVGEGLQAQLFAAEPMLHSPSGIDVDHRGRVWVCEIVNYRGKGSRPEGDRILVLEDTDHDGRADRKTVFYQGTDINTPHGVCVLPEPNSDVTRVIVSTATRKPGAHVTLLTDTDGDLKADEKKLLFTGISGAQHDHSIHAFVFGPDGRLYFNMGNVGRQIRDADGEPIVDRAGNEVATDGKPYRQGLVFRCYPEWIAGVEPTSTPATPSSRGAEGSRPARPQSHGGFETLGWNFRNNWEVAVDSFGTLWQSDNDDDGNRGVRINYVMEFGNYGYQDEMSGAGWRTPRIGMAEDIPTRHWHQNDPGVVPNLLQTGAGSPTGIMVYEGTLLPEVFHGQMIHCDAGPNVVRAYPVSDDGAGYKAEIVDILKGTRDKWFRPSDVCVAPDGSLIIADWYDPGVGGHNARDLQSGRLFRVIPEGHDGSYRSPPVDVSSIDGAVAALASPSLSVRYMGWSVLHEMRQKAEPALQKVYENSDDPRLQARALWLLAQIPGTGLKHAVEALSHPNPDIRITGLRAVRQIVPRLPQIRASDPSGRKQIDVSRQDVLIAAVEKLFDDPSPQVRRECAIALSVHNAPGLSTERAARWWAKLAAQHEAGDRWYLEALGIGARGRWDACLQAWLEKVDGDWNTPAGRDILWRSRSAKTPELLAAIISDADTPTDELPRYLRAFDFQSGPKKAEALLQLAFAEPSDDEERDALVAGEALKRLEGIDVGKRPEYRKALSRVLNRYNGTPLYVQLIDKFNLADRYRDLLALAQSKPDEQIGVEAIRVLLQKNQRDLLKQGFSSEKLETALGTVRALGNSADGRIAELLLPVARDESYRLEVRRQSVQAVAKTRNGARRIVQMARRGALDERLKGAAAASLHAAPWGEVKQAAARLFPLPESKDAEPLPPLEQLLKMNGDVAGGRVVFNTTGTCAKCHKVDGIGKDVGPDLTEIGEKLSRRALFDSVLFPSAGISHNYETYTVVTKGGNVVSGILTSETPASVTLKGSDSLERTFRRSDIAVMKEESTSLMPADLQKTMTAQELVDVVSYMQTLRKQSE